MPTPAEPSHRALAGRGVLVTRPRHQAPPLVARIEQHGGRALTFPLLTIAAASDRAAACAALDAVLEASAVIFVSANAVRLAAQLEPQLAARLAARCTFAVGGATARALVDAGVSAPTVAATGSSSDALLALDALAASAVSGQRVGVVKGEGGRRVLVDTLTGRGAEVMSASVYRRDGPDGDFAAFLRDHGAAVDLAIVTSAEALDHLVRITPAGRRDAVLAWPLVLPSARVAAHASALGFCGPVRAVDSMCDAALVAASAALLAAGTRVGGGA